jgi:hypothetical protein
MAGLLGNRRMNEVYLWIVTAVVAAVAAGTITRLWTDRSRLWRDELQDEDRLFAWRIVLFLFYPALVGLDLRATLAAAQAFGGSVEQWTYGFFWYSAVPQGVSTCDNLMLVLFAGAIVQLLLALSLIPSLFFRPHPFLATLIGYLITAILGANLIVEPILSLVGLGGSRWQLAMTLGTAPEKTYIISVYAVLTAMFIYFSTREKTRLWFADISRPVVAEKLRDAQMNDAINPGNLITIARLAIMYERAGLVRQSKLYLQRLQAMDSRALSTVFTYAVLKYRQRKYVAAREAFILAADYVTQDAGLKSSLLSAAACAAFAQGDMQGALNLSERSLEFDDAGLVARMVKVDVFLRTGRKEQAGDEIVAAIRRGLDMDLESKIPLDVDRALVRIQRVQAAAEKRLRSAVS